MIAHLTGREVKLVPPTAYLVSASTKPQAAASVELVHAADLPAQLGSAAGPLEVEITSVLHTGTASRMVVSSDHSGGLVLHAAVNVEL